MKYKDIKTIADFAKGIDTKKADETFKAIQELAYGGDFHFSDIAKLVEQPATKKVEDIMKPVPSEPGDRLPHYKLEVPADFLRWKKNKIDGEILLGNGKQEVDMKIYLSDFLSDLGDNCIFEKGSTGCGGTTLALNQNDRHVIVAMPTRNTVQSKEVIRGKDNNIIGKRNDVFCIWGGHNDHFEDLAAYLEKKKTFNEKVKIVCTYDQIGKLYNRLMGRDNMGNINHGMQRLAYNPLNWWLYIDEMHEVINAYQGERRESIRQMLDLIKVVKHVVFITATPLKEEFFFSQIFDQEGRFKVVKVDFPEWTKMKPQIVRRQTPKVVYDVGKEMKAYLKNEGNLFEAPLNAHVFVNSLDVIISILRRIDYLANLERIRIVCGQGDDNNQIKLVRFIEKEVAKMVKEGKEIPNKSYLDDVIDGKVSPISSINDSPKKINFYTSTAFCGADIFDKNEQIYVVTVSSRKHTYYDISTTFLQIIGRVRDCKNPTVFYYYDKNAYKDNDKEWFKKHLHNIEEGQKTLLSGSKDSLMLWYEQGFLEENYITKRIDSEGNPYFVDDELLRFKDKINWEVFNDQLSTEVNMNATFIQCGISVKTKAAKEVQEVQEVQERFRNPAKRGTFEEKITQYYQLRDKGEAHGVDGEVVASLEKLYPEYRDIYDLYTFDEIKKAGFTLRSVIGERGTLLAKRKLEKRKGDIIALLNSVGVSPGAELDSKKKKAAEKAIMDGFGFKKFKLQDVFKVQSVQRKVKGKNTRITIIEG